MVLVAFSSLAAVWWCLAVGLLAVTLACGLLQPFVQRRRAKAAARPPVSAILPVKHVDAEFVRTQASMFAQDYPDYEVLAGAAEGRSDAVAALQDVASAYPARAFRFYPRTGSFAVSPKLDNLAAPLAAARHDLVMTKDSNVGLSPRAMAAFAACMTPGVGLVVGVPVACGAKSYAGWIEASVLNAHARLLLSASTLGFGFGVGKAMMFRRSDLARAGGVRALADTLAEDTALCEALAALGLRTVFAPESLRQEIGARRLRDVFERQARWAVIRRGGAAPAYALEPLASPLPAALAAALAAPLVGVGAGAAFAVTLIGWFALETGFAALKGWEISRWSAPAYLGREILALAAWARGFATHQVIWADSRFDARVGPQRPAAPGKP
ncbi:glycosyltransferase [Methylocella sp.]|uniref:glycosyltransferase n=1 Tax=Methylocella sp. TaxID=1978226 RepID=UPI003783F852